MSQPIASAWDLTGGLHVTGVTQIGEVTSRTMREAETAPDFTEVWKAGYRKALEDMAAFQDALLAQAGEYDDTRPITTAQTWIADRLRIVPEPQATIGN